MTPRQFCVRASIALFAVALFPLVASAQSVRERISFNADWRFSKGDPAGVGDALSYSNLKSRLVATGKDFAYPGSPASDGPLANPGGDVVAYVADGFDDSSWRKVDLPHDWGIEGPFNQDLPGETGKLPWSGVGWYRKTFELPDADIDLAKRVYLDVDGAMSYAAVWLNGQFVGGWPYGYASWRMDLTPYLLKGQRNVLAIRLDNPPLSSRWYPGSGIYRNVWLVKTNPVHVAQWGTFIRTPVVTPESALVDIDVLVQNDTTGEKGVQVSTAVFALDRAGNKTGQPVAATPLTRPSRIAVDRQGHFAQTLTVPQPKLWSVKTPNRYVAVTTVTQDGKVADVYETPFGIRTIAFDPSRGFLLNGERLQIKGVCNHHDLGALGNALNLRALERQLEILQEMGCNAIRTSHNPPAPELLDLCDRMGFIVMDEAFDMWRSAKKPNDYHVLYPDWHEKDLRAFIRRDRNHPCVVMWSIGNEVREQTEPEGWKVAAHLASIVRAEDTTRPVVTGCNNVNAGFAGFQKAVDVLGYNYATRNPPDSYGRFHAMFPHIPLIASETSSAVSSRGEYFFPVVAEKTEGKANFQISSYDLYTPRWGVKPDDEFKALESYPFLAGEFVWTGFDYLGEPTPYSSDATNILNFTDPAQQERVAKELADMKKIRVPSRSSYFGIVDLAGFKKDRFYLYQAHWRPDFPMAHLLPHWTWPERTGQVTPVHVYTSGDEAELFLNGQSLGRKKKGALEYRLRWDEVTYAPGELRVIAYKNGARWAEDTVRTAGSAAKLGLSADRGAIRADGQDLSFITLTILDKNGVAVPRSHNVVKFEISGPGVIIATDNGDATSFESFQAKERRAYNGLALAIVRTRTGEAGEIKVRATSDGLVGAEIVVRSE